MTIFVFFGLIFAAFLVWVLRLQLQRSRRNNLFLKPLPPDWIQILEKNVSIYSLLPQNLREELHGRINIFLDEKEFIGCAGLQISNEIRVTIAGNACILLLKRDKRCFPRFTTILIYPDTYVSREVKSDGLVVVHEESVRAGESWYRGPVVLSWADVMRGSLNNSDGHNVVLHEFAHKLDEENEIMNGLPVLRDSSHYAEWAEVLSKEFDSLLIRIDRGTNSVIDAYGAVSPPEFFAVATESFFEKPLLMKNKLPDLYQQFRRFYNLDPAAWRNTS
ncbi:MAG: zinc-dependent peptidase [Gammaproteobacteria bacterium]